MSSTCLAGYPANSVSLFQHEVRVSRVTCLGVIIVLKLFFIVSAWTIIWLRNMAINISIINPASYRLFPYSASLITPPNSLHKGNKYHKYAKSKQARKVKFSSPKIPGITRSQQNTRPHWTTEPHYPQIYICSFSPPKPIITQRAGIPRRSKIDM